MRWAPLAEASPHPLGRAAFTHCRGRKQRDRVADGADDCAGRRGRRGARCRCAGASRGGGRGRRPAPTRHTPSRWRPGGPSPSSRPVIARTLTRKRTHTPAPGAASTGASPSSRRSRPTADVRTPPPSPLPAAGLPLAERGRASGGQTAGRIVSPTPRTRPVTTGVPGQGSSIGISSSSPAVTARSRRCSAVCVL
jgi:hypothetical protein